MVRIFLHSYFFVFNPNPGKNGLEKNSKKRIWTQWKICSSKVARAVAVAEVEGTTVLKGDENSGFHHHEEWPSF